MVMDMLSKNRARERTDELLSAYIDGALSPRERARLEARLATDPELRARLESLQRTVALVRAMPSVRAPRSFRLTPAMVRRPAPTARRLAPALTFATAVSGLLCVVLLVGNLIAAGWGGMGAAAPAPMVAYEEPASERAPMPPATPEAQELLSQAMATPTIGPPLPTEPLATPEESPEVRAWSDETPHPLEGGPGPGMGGGGAAPSPGEPSEPSRGLPPAPAPEETPSEPAGFAIAAEVTPSPAPTGTPEPLSGPGAPPGGRPALPPSSWLPVGGLALLTAFLAVLSLRAWRAR